MATVRHVLKVFAVAGGLAETALQSGAEVPVDNIVAEVKSADDSANQNESDSANQNDSAGPSGQFRESQGAKSADDYSLSTKLGFGLSEQSRSSLRNPRTHAKRRGRRNKPFQVLSRRLQEPTAESRMGIGDPWHHGVTTTISGHRFANHPGINRRETSVRAAFMTLVIVLVAVWLAKQISAYRRASEKLSVVRNDHQQLLTQIQLRSQAKWGSNMLQETEKQQNDSVDGKGSEAELQDRFFGDRDAESDEDAWNKELLAELFATRKSLSQLRQRIPEAGHSSPIEKERPKKVPESTVALSMTHEEAIKEIKELEEEVKLLKQKSEELKAIVKLRADIQREEASVQEYAAKALSMGGSIGAPNSLYKSLDALQQELTELKDDEKLKQVEEIKAKLRNALEDARETCIWTPGLSELDLLVEKDKLLKELSSTREKIENNRKPLDGLLEGFYKITGYPSSILQSWTQRLWWIYNPFGGERISQGTGGPSETLPTVSEQVHVEETKRPEETRTPDRLKKELAETETLNASLNRIHSCDSEQFAAWLARKNSQAKATTQVVVSTLRNLPPVPSDVQNTTESQKLYTTTLASSILKAQNALERVDQ